jgi:hypothetical protein
LGIALESLPYKREGDGQTEIPLPVKGWRLIKDRQEGYLIQVNTGWLTDENELYILKDWRRVTEAEAKKSGLRFGTERDPVEGLKDILGAIPSEGLKTEYKSINLLNDKINDTYLIDKMHVVVFQVPQINVCYAPSSEDWQQCTRKHTKYRNSRLETVIETADFKSIRTDETRIPIVVTRIGSERAEKKIIIAGPHGDERNAQRLIKKSQKYFIQKGAPEYGTVLYFIPCISPTMAFADARGIPIVNERGELNFNRATDSVVKTLEEYRKGIKKIPDLHDLIATKIKVDEKLLARIGKIKTELDEQDRYELLMRSAIQKYNGDLFKNGEANSAFPNFGIDANRDYHLALPSSKAFLNFIKMINTGDIPNLDTRETDKQKREEIARKILDRNIRVLMMHGYNDLGRAFCPYWADENAKPKWKLDTTENDKIHVKAIISTLKMQPIGDILENYIWKDTRDNPPKYLGEWLRRLYTECKIWTCDVELGSGYDEEIRGATDSRVYKHLRIDDETLPYFKTSTEENGFLALLGNYPWE